MARGINKVILIGNLGADPETRHTASGTNVCNLRLAVSDSWKGKDGATQERTEWVQVVCFGRLAEIAGEYLSKGRQVYVEGRLQTRKWQDKSGADRYTTEVVASELQMLGSKLAEPTGRTDSQRSVDAQRPAGGGGQTEPTEFDDEIPFVLAMTTQPRP